MSRLGGKLARLEEALHARRRRRGTIEWHHPDGTPLSHDQQPCDLRDEHGPDCVMTVSPTNSGMRSIYVIHGPDSPHRGAG
jgi:hypothetical protein